MKITSQLLREHNACLGGLAAFERTFPDGAELTPENLRAAVAAGLDVAWAVSALALTCTVEHPDGTREWWRDGSYRVRPRSVPRKGGSRCAD